MEREEKKRIKPLEVLGRYKYVLLVAALGAALLVWPAEGGKSVSGSQVEDNAPVEEAAQKLETDLEEILSKIQGVGRVDVLLTLHSGRELVLASDTTLRYSGSVQAPDEYDRTSETVLASTGGDDGVVVTQQRFPLYRGALVVCDGGGSDSVRLEVMEAVSALTGLGSDRIAVTRWQPGTAATGSTERNLE